MVAFVVLAENATATEWIVFLVFFPIVHILASEALRYSPVIGVWLHFVTRQRPGT